MQQELDAQLREDSDCPPSELETWPDWREQRCAHVLVPAYVVRYRAGRKTFDATVNGGNGTVAATQPINWLAAFAVLAAALAVVAGAIYALFRLLS